MGRRNDALAVLSLCLGVFVFSFQDVVVKALSGSYPVHQIILLRCAAALPILLVFLGLTGGVGTLLSKRFGVLALRGVLLVLSYAGFYLAFPVMKLADVIALFATAPLFIAALAGLVLGERIDARRGIAVGIGFLGAVVMLRPGAGVFEPVALLPVSAAFLYAAAQIMARRLGIAVPAAAMAFHQNFVFFLAAGVLALGVTLSGGSDYDHPSLAFLLGSWSAASIGELALMAACGPIAVLGTTLLAQAYRSAEANLVASFEYTGLIWATLWGYSLWGEVPGPSSLLGGALIVASGLYVVSAGTPQPRPQPQAAEPAAPRPSAAKA